ncbi:hypothetical protein IWW36_004008 [Coemansia brasiliensis]|uniref:Zinc transporter n=1 Tax=Coemansia brasiliensis TaxID=2650707 RepID=A0A9W8LZG7_9FUNG|nr:hypothetical protein IWW36_004008 [Coemansia brasiliensis]
MSTRKRPLYLLALIVFSICSILASAAATGVETPSGLFGRCPLFDRVVKEEMLSGQITPEQAFAELDSHNCPIIRGASITSPQQLKAAVEQDLSVEEHQNHPDITSCQRLGELKQMLWEGPSKPKQVMDELVANNCPSLTSCEQFGEIKTQYTNGKLTPSKAIQQLVQRCPLFSPPVSAPQVKSKSASNSNAPPGQSMADECRRLSDMLYTVDDQQITPENSQIAQTAMDTLCENKVPIINNCPLFQSVKQRYQSSQISAQEAVAEMKASCPILSKELNPAMIFNFEEYGMHRDRSYDVGHESHSHKNPTQCSAGCCCAGGNAHKASPAKELFKRDNEFDDPELCVRDGKNECTHGHHFTQRSDARTSGLEKLLGGVFPKGNPALSSLLGTFYISLFPNLILFATPSSIPNKLLRIMVGFAVGGLLGDVFLHLLPHMFGDEHDHSHSHSHDHVRNTVYGCTIFLGLMVFFSVDKFMRLLGSGHSHHHGHSHAHEHHGRSKTKDSGSSSASESESKQRVRKRRATKHKQLLHDANEADDEKDAFDELVKETKKPIKLSAYLNLIADATHNFTDGLAMSASFYLSHAAGLSTFVAVFFHEIPHELGDFAILVQSGFSRTSALASQFFTALGAIAGTIAGIMIEEASRGNSFNFRGLYTPDVPMFAPALDTDKRSLLGMLFSSVFYLLPSTVAGVPWSKLVIPFTAGGFMYVGTVSVLPDLLQPDEEDSGTAKGRMAKHLERQKTRRGITMAFVELGAMLVGLGIMAAIALTED